METLGFFAKDDWASLEHLNKIFTIVPGIYYFLENKNKSWLDRLHFFTTNPEMCLRFETRAKAEMYKIQNPIPLILELEIVEHEFKHESNKK